MITWKEIPTVAKWITYVVGGLAALGTAGSWGWDRAGSIYTTSKAEALEQELREHHDKDTQLVLQMIADEKKADRIQRNQEKLNDYERDLLGGKYSNENEHEFIIIQIKDLKAALKCDIDGICR